jgi:tRNA pseudouridine55 synthase
MKEKIHGWIALDKPLGMTSTRAVAAVKRLFRAEKCGHGGTLDPLATGLLPIALGEATKTVQWAMDGEKTYRFDVTFGEERSTHDLEGEVTATSPDRPTADRIEMALPQFRGDILQAPPAFSALKIAGKRAYDLARRGETRDLEPRPAHIGRLELVERIDENTARFETDCGKGTYIRALARDIGRVLGCYGHISMLRRSRVGAFREDMMIPLASLQEICDQAPGSNAMDGVLRPIETVLDGIPALAVDERQAQRLRQGQEVLLRGHSVPVAADAVLILMGLMPVGIGGIDRGMLKPKRLFNL